ncbi:Uu.00g036320.m01.CDS01 [Anthostomella pinea]|uniref:Uu.00g036320.m01.CDS01 n=1 Tax=Anthostomella pinea TaxID=933095 RepID=A0AAI8V9E8_9PEZI|nr:Uu.00g036320.m01.CDS01 [Anthostomella pinea]
MDEPGCSWQFWKFGMKRADLDTKLHDQYNTVAFSIQDPDAFHSDVYEISNTAATIDEFHSLLAERKGLRLRELNESLESASLEIIANPSLIGTHQWQHALQLFRTKSLDSLVSYFASYLPEDHPWNPSSASTANPDPTYKPYYDDIDDYGHVLTHEPLSIPTGCSSIPASHFPPSPRSLTTCSDSSSASTPARSMSFCEQQSDSMALSGTLTHAYDDDDETSQSDDPDTPTTSISDMSEIHPLDHERGVGIQYADAAATPAELYLGGDIDESETPTPRSALSSEPLTTSKKSETSLSSLFLSANSNLLPRGSCHSSPGVSRIRRRSPDAGRVQKPSPGPMRIRPKGRIRHGG